MTEARGWNDARNGSWAKECQWPTESRKGKTRDLLLESLEGTSPDDTLTSAQ